MNKLLTTITLLCFSVTSFALECTSRNPYSWNAVRPAGEWFSQYYSHEEGEWKETRSIERSDINEIRTTSLIPAPLGLYRFDLYQPYQGPEQSYFNLYFRHGLRNYLKRHFNSDEIVTLRCTTGEPLQCRNEFLGVYLLFNPISNEGYLTIMEIPELYQIADDNEVYVPIGLGYDSELKEEYLRTPPRLSVEHFRCE